MENTDQSHELIDSEVNNSNGVPIEDPSYPSIPKIEETKQSIQKSLSSVFLYFALAYAVLDWDIIFILQIIGVLVIHELGHYLAMKIFKYENLNILFLPLVGAVCIGDKENISQKQSIIVSFAGPLPGILIGVALYFFGVYLEQSELISIANIFIILNVFNLLPFMPLDGGRILNAIFLNNNVVLGIIFSILSIVALISIAIYLESFFFLIVPFFLVIQLITSYNSRQVKKSLGEQGLPTESEISELSNKEYWLIRDELGKTIPALKRLITPGNYVISNGEKSIISNMKTTIRKKPIKDLSWLGKIGFITLWLASFIIPALVLMFSYELLN
jgi:Zn-dependent protease